MSAEPTGLDEAKAALRARMRELRAGFAPDVRAAESAAAAQRAVALPEVAGARVVVGYHALAEELDPSPLLTLLRERGARVALPRVSAPGELTLHWVEGNDELLAGSLGIMEPAADGPGPGLDVIDLVIVPGIAFDAHGRRLGFGGGFYDRLLARLSATTRTVAIAYDVQVVAEVPSGECDHRVQVVVTPTAVHRA